MKQTFCFVYLLSTVCGFLLLPSIALSDSLSRIDVIHDGSFDPPGFLVKFSLHASSAGPVRIETRAFTPPAAVLNEAEDTSPIPVTTNDKKFSDASGNLLASVTADATMGEDDLDLSVYIPYSAINLPYGRHDITFMLSVFRGSNEACSYLTDAPTIEIKDLTRTLLRRITTKQESRIGDRKAALVSDGGVATMEYEAINEVDVPFAEEKEDVAVYRGFTRVDRKFAVVKGEHEEVSPLVLQRRSLEGKIIVPAENAISLSDRTIYCATTRKIIKPQASDVSKYGDDIAPGLRFSVFHVNIPLTGVRSNEASSSISKLMRLFRSEKHFSITSTQHLHGEGEFLQLISPRTPPIDISSANDVLVFVHGYNNSLEFASLRMAQIANEIGFRGKKLIFSWPSQSDIADYKTDWKMADSSKLQMANLIRILTDGRLGKGRVHIIAHSMGCRLLLHAISDYANSIDLHRERPAIGNVVLAAPDISHKEFQSKIGALLSASSSVTVYACNQDKALQLSNALARLGGSVYNGPPVGLVVDTAEYPWPIFFDSPKSSHRLDNIDASRVDTSFISHDYFVTHSGVTRDMAMNIVDDTGTEGRVAAGLLKAHRVRSNNYWSLR